MYNIDSSFIFGKSGDKGSDFVTIKDKVKNYENTNFFELG